MADVATLSALIQLRGQARANRGLKDFQANLRRAGQNAGELGRTLGVVAAPFVVAAGLGIRAAIEMESSFTGLRKTVNATEAEFAAIERGLRDMARQIPVNVNELNRIGEAAGQLGIQQENLMGFIKVMAALGVTTNLTAEEAATAMAKIANVMNLPQTAFENFGSVLVELGNNLATTEAEILTFARRLSGAANIAGLTVPQLLAISGAMSSVGVEAQAGGTAVQKVILGMSAAAKQGNADLSTFARVAGMSSRQFAQSFQEDAGPAFTAFVEGLGRAGLDGIRILEDLGFADVRLIRAFLSLAGAGDLLRNTIEMGTSAWDENTALTKEAALRYATTASQVQLFKNKLNEAAIVLGETLIPMLTQAVKAVTPLVEGFAEFARNHPTLVKVVAISAAALGALGIALLGVGIIAPGIATGIGLLAGAGTALAAVGWAGIASGIAGIGVASATALGPIAALAAAVATIPSIFKTADAFLAQDPSFLSEGGREAFGSGKNPFKFFNVALEEIKATLGGVASEFTGAFTPALKEAGGSTGDLAKLVGGDLDKAVTDLGIQLDEAAERFAPGLTRAVSEAAMDIEDFRDAVVRMEGLLDLRQELQEFRELREVFRSAIPVVQGLDSSMLNLAERNRNLAAAMSAQRSEAFLQFESQAAQILSLREWETAQQHVNLALNAMPNLADMFADGLLTQGQVIAAWQQTASAINETDAALSNLQTNLAAQNPAFPPMFEGFGQTREERLLNLLGGMPIGGMDTIRRALSGVGVLQERLGEALPGFAQGGTVGGALGSPQLAVVHGGETVIPAGRGGGRGLTINNTFTGDVYGIDDLTNIISGTVVDVINRGGFRELVD